MLAQFATPGKSSSREAGKIKPEIYKTFPLEQAAEAHRFIQSRQNIGKVVLTT